MIGERTKIDNLCHIGHNVVMGRDCVMAAFGGISGSVTIGDGCQFGGRVGTVDHITIGAGARLGAGGGSDQGRTRRRDLGRNARSAVQGVGAADRVAEPRGRKGRGDHER